MKEAMINMLQNIINQGVFLAELSADVSALKIVVSSLDVSVRNALEKQVSVERGRIQQHIEAQRESLEMLRQLISRLPTEPSPAPKPN
jgi:hypothetical protein